MATKKVAAKSAAASVKRSPANKASAKKAAAKSNSSGRKYSPAAAKQVGEELHEMHKRKLHIGKSDKLVTNPKQAIAIGLAEARRAGKKVPPNPNDPKKK